MKRIVAVLLLCAACFMAFVASPLFPRRTQGIGAWQVVRYTMGVESLGGTDIFAADSDGDGLITLADAVHIALKAG